MTERASFVERHVTTHALVGVALLLSACAADSPAGECARNSDCKSDEVCNLLMGECVHDLFAVEVEELQFRGAFQCEVDGEKASTSLGVSEIVGRYDGEHVALTVSANCSIQESTGEMHLTIIGSRTLPHDQTGPRSMLFQLYANAEKVRKNATISLGEDPSTVFTDTTEFAGASLSSLDDQYPDSYMFLAFSIGGSIHFDANLEPGKRLSGELNVQLAPQYPGQVGEACEGFLDCDHARSLSCLSLGCTRPCATQGDCNGLDAVCTQLPWLDGGFCLAPCQRNTDCAPGAECTFYGEGQGICGPAVLVGVDDPATLGSSCTRDADCNNPYLACVSLAGAPKICTEACTDECLGYVGLEAQCFAFADDSYCLQQCNDAWDCAAGLVCALAGESMLCVPPELVAPSE